MDQTPSLPDPPGSRLTELHPRRGKRANVQSNGSSPPTDPHGSEQYWNKSDTKGWFDLSNRRAITHQTRALEDGTSPPHFLRQSSSSSPSEAISSAAFEQRRKLIVHDTPTLVHSMSAGKSDDYRSVIDDLTIENRKLKRRLKKYEAARRPHLDKERLFEVKFHGLPPKKRRELDEQLSAFAASIEALEGNDNQITTQNSCQTASSLSNSAPNSRPADSGYNSMSNFYHDMSNSGPTSNANSDRKSPPNVEAKGKRLETFLNCSQEGLLPNATAMSEREKKKLVVKRLERLFAGKISPKGEHRQPIQQQDVSNMDAKFDVDARVISPFKEGVREAHMLKHPIDIGAMDSEDQISSDQEPKTDSSRAVSPGQRPTRALDLDPNRAQIPSDNVNYIKHLGISPPRLTAEASDGDGWIYLNLLMSMAQLHIINVTADFVRSAVTDMSEYFQLSSDGQKIRWKGDEGRKRKISSDEESIGKIQSPQDRDSLEGTASRRHTVDRGKFATIPIGSRDSQISDARISPLDPFHYKPLFKHRESSSGDDFDTDSCSSSKRSAPSSKEKVSSSKESKSTRSKKRHGKDHGGIVFYNGHFCIDLSGDPRRRPSITMEAPNVGADVLGYPRKRRVYSRTTSGSSIPTIPFKNFARESIQGTALAAEPSTDELDALALSMDWPSSTPTVERPLLPLEVSGIGGTHPSDHFALRVRTRRTLLSNRARAKYSTYVHSPRRLAHTIHDKRTIEALTSSRHRSTELPIKTEFISEQFTQLEPSPLPAPSNFYDLDSNSDDSDGSEGSSRGISQSGQSRLQLQQSSQATIEPEDEEMDNEEDETSSGSRSFDMLAAARLAHSQPVLE